MKIEDDGFYNTDINQKAISRYQIAKTIKSLDDFVRISGFSSNDELISAPWGEGIGFHTLGERMYYFDLYHRPFSFPEKILEIIDSDIAALANLSGEIEIKDQEYHLKDAFSFKNKIIGCKSRDLIEAVAFEREITRELDEKKFGIYSAFCTWKDFNDNEQKSDRYFYNLIKDQFQLDERGDNGTLMDIAREVQDTLLSARIWDKDFRLDPMEAAATLKNGMTKLSSVDLAQFDLMNGMHSCGLFLGLAVVLEIVDWNQYIDLAYSNIYGGYSQPDDEDYQKICEDSAIIKMLGDLYNH